MNPSVRKKLSAAWIRKMGRAANWVQNQEAALDKMRAKGINPEFIETKSAELDDILDVINTADELINLYKNELISLRLECQLLQSQLSESQTLDFITKPTSQILAKLHETQKKPGSGR